MKKDFWNLNGYDENNEDYGCDCCSRYTCGIEAEKEIALSIYIYGEIVGLLAGVKGILMYLARNLETEEDIERTRDDLIELQDDIDRIVSEYAVSCVYNFILGF